MSYCCSLYLRKMLCWGSFRIFENLTHIQFQYFLKINNLMVRQWFHWTSVHDLNLCYCTIQVNFHAKNICTIILHGDEYLHKCNNRHIRNTRYLSGKMSYLMRVHEFVKVCLNDLLVIPFDTFGNYLEKLLHVN